MSKVKILVLGPQKAGKTTLANILGDLQDGLSTVYRPTVGARIVDFERDPPAAVSQFGKIHVELWDVSGDFKYEKCWAPCQQDVQGIIFVYDPTNPESEGDLIKYIENFPKALKMKQSLCQAFINYHNYDGTQQGSIPKSLGSLDKFTGSIEDTQQVFAHFDKYLTKLLKQLIENQTALENQYAQ